MASDYAELAFRRLRGWPWPDDSWGLSPMYGEAGWCRSCGVPFGPQIGSIVLRSVGLTPRGVWVPNWAFDVVCCDGLIAAELGAFGLEVRSVGWPGKGSGVAFQILVPVSESAWYEATELEPVIDARHGRSSVRCSSCGVLRWLPMRQDALPLPNSRVFVDGPAAVASPEWFGDGKNAFRHVLWRRDVAEFLHAASPRDFTLRPLARR